MKIQKTQKIQKAQDIRKEQKIQEAKKIQKSKKIEKTEKIRKEQKLQNKGDTNRKEIIGNNVIKDISLYFLRSCIFMGLFFLMYCDVPDTSQSALTLSIQVKDYIKIIPIYAYLLVMMSDRKERVKNGMIAMSKGITLIILLAIIKHNYDNCSIFQSSLTSYQNVVLIIALLAISWIYPEKLEKQAKKLQGMQYVIALISPLMALFLNEYIVNPTLKDMKLYFFGMNLLLYGIVFYLLVTLIGNMKVSLYLYYSLALLLALADYFVFMFRGKPLVPTDFYSLGTAYQVAGDYHYSLNNRVVIGILLYLVCIVIIRVMPLFYKTKAQRVRGRVSALCVMIVFCISFQTVPLQKSLDISVDYWTPHYMYYRSGFALSYLTLLQNMQEKKPEGYSQQAVEEILQRMDYGPSEEKDNNHQKNPTIIAIMNETFSDLSVIRKDLKQACFIQWDSIPNCIT